MVSSPIPPSEMIQQQATMAEETQRRLNFIDKRIADAEKRAEKNRQLKSSSALNMSLAGKPLLYHIGTLKSKHSSLGSLHVITGEGCLHIRSVYDFVIARCEMLILIANDLPFMLM